MSEPTDLVERLRDYGVAPFDTVPFKPAICAEAADTIESLRATNTALRRTIDGQVAVIEAARLLWSRRASGPSEDANIFGEWDTLEQALAELDK